MEQLALEKSLIKVRERAEEILEHSHLMLSESIDAFFAADRKKSNTVIHTLERRMNDLDVIMEEQCIETIAMYQVRAKHLRFLIMLIKINTDLERMGDLSMSIADYNIKILDIQSTSQKNFLENDFLKNLSTATLNLHKLMREAFIEEDTDKAVKVIESDIEINNLRDEAIKKTLAASRKHPEQIELSYALIRITQRLERIGDLCKNVAEDILYIVDGSIYKH